MYGVLTGESCRVVPVSVLSYTFSWTFLDLICSWTHIVLFELINVDAAIDASKMLAPLGRKI